MKPPECFRVAFHIGSAAIRQLADNTAECHCGSGEPQRRYLVAREAQGTSLAAMFSGCVWRHTTADLLEAADGGGFVEADFIQSAVQREPCAFALHGCVRARQVKV